MMNECSINVRKEVAKRFVGVRIDPEVFGEIERLGDRFGFNLSEYIRSALDEKLERDLARIGQKQHAQ